MPPSEGKAQGNYHPKKKKKSKFGYGFLPKQKKHKDHSFTDFYNLLKHPKKDNYGHSMYDNRGGKKKKRGGGKTRNASGSSSGYSSGGSGHSGYSSGSSRSGGGGGGGRRGRGGRGGKGKGGNAYARMRATTMVRADDNAQILALLNQARGQRRAKDYDIRNANALYGRTKGDLDYLFNEARDFNASQSAKIDQRFGATQGDMAELYDNFMGEQNTAVDARKQAAMNELQRLGIQQSGMGQFDADAQNTSANAALSQSNALANLSAMREGAGEVGDLLQGMATGSQNQFTGTAMNRRNDDISKTRQDFSQYMQQILGKTNEMRAQDFNKINDLAMQLKQSAPMKRSKKNKRRVLKSYAAQQRRSNRLNRALGGVR